MSAKAVSRTARCNGRPSRLVFSLPVGGLGVSEPQRKSDQTPLFAPEECSLQSYCTPKRQI